MTLRQVIRESDLPAARSPRQRRDALDGFQAEEVAWLLGHLTGATLISGAYKRWTYTWTEAEVTSAGDYQEKSGGRTGSALNVAEGANTSSVVANGVDPTNFSGSFAVIPANGYVELTARRYTDGSVLWTFSAPVIDGSCAA